MQKKIFKIIALTIFYIVGISLYISFMVIDGRGNDSTFIKYGVVISSLSFSLLSFLFIKDKKDIIDVSLLSIGLVFTLISDYFLLVANSNFEVGVTTFIFAQLSYFARYIFINKYSRYQIVTFSTIRLVLPVIGIIVLVSIKELSLLYVLVVIYFIQLLMNFVEAILMFIKDKKISSLLLGLGFLLFIGCDICVGLANIGYNEMYNISWVFYAPSQLLIASHFVLNKLYEKEE